MDSNLKRKAILIGLSLITLVVLLVLLANYGKLKEQSVQSSVADNEQNTAETETDTSFRYGDELSESELRSFLLNETFFDEEPSEYSDVSIGRKLSFSVISVEKDLRVRIYNVAGQPATGEIFTITIDDFGEYRDFDKDGVVYIDDIPAGEYYVSLNQREGYSVPDSKVKVNVKSQVEYTPIDDINYYIYSEDEIDSKAEDTRVNAAKSEGDETEYTLPLLSDGTYRFGIDVSKWNKSIKWYNVASDGVDFAIIRVGYRGSSTGTLVEDPYFQTNVEGALDAGIDVGLYFFTQATTEVEAVEEASMVLALCKEYDITYPIYIDTEGAGGKGRADSLDKTTRTAVCKAFCETIKNGGYTAGVYASKNWLNSRVKASEFEGYAIWLAEYRDTATYTGDFHMWQYTSKGSISGISGNVDLNISYMDDSSAN